MSEKPLAERLQVKGGRRLAIVGATDGMEALIGVSDARTAAPEADVVLLFVENRATLEAELLALLPQMRPDSILWIAYLKLSSERSGDLNRDVIRALAPAHGLDTVSQIAIDRDWSALRMKRLI